MVINILGPWVFTPVFRDNKKQPAKEQLRIKMHVLSGREELALGSTAYQDLILASIDEIENPPILRAPDGSRQMETEDLVKVPELKSLFLEIMKEYGAKNGAGIDPGN